ncbi:MAG: hypothetical protein P8Y93_08275 [Acidobacteriota bacterium]
MGDLGYRYGLLFMGAESRVFSTTPNPFLSPGALMLWSIEDKRLLSEDDRGFSEDTAALFFDSLRKRFVVFRSEGDRSSVEAIDFKGRTERLGVLPFDIRSAKNCREPTGSWMSFQADDGIYVNSIGDRSLSEPRRIAHVPRLATAMKCDPRRRFVATMAESGLIQLWNLDGPSPPIVIMGPSAVSDLKIFENELVLEAEDSRENTIDLWIWSFERATPKLLRHIELGRAGGVGSWAPDPSHSQLASIINPDPYIRVWSLRSPADSEPMILRRGEAGLNRMVGFDPSGEWLAVSGTNGLTFWAIKRPYPVEINRYEERVGNLVFGPEGRTLATSSVDGRGSVRLWNLDDEVIPAAQLLYAARPHAYGIAASPDGMSILVGTQQRGAQLVSSSQGDDRALPGSVPWVWGVAFSPSGRYAAAHGIGDDGSSRRIQVWDLSTDRLIKSFESGENGLYSAHSILFTDDNHLLSGGRAGLRMWDLNTGDVETLYRHPVDRFAFSSSKRRVLVSKAGPTMGSLSTHGSASIVDLDAGTKHPMPEHHDRITAVAMSEDGDIAVTGTADGVIRVGRVGGGEPHVLLVDADEIFDLAIDPKNRWIAVASGTQIRLWPMPDLSKPPLHTLPREELIAKLKTLTNLRAVRDEDSSTGWKIEVGPFPGWETVPTW